MLINFTIENWKSFREKVTLNLMASNERQHNERIPRVNKFNARILPVSVLYGGNASGKSNIFQALSFVKSFITGIVHPEQSIPVEPFKLDKHSLDKPTYFSFAMLIDELIYEYSFSVTRKAVLSEKLVKINSANEYVLFERNEKQKNPIKFPYLRKAAKQAKLKEYLNFVYRGTQKNQLFLTNCYHQNVHEFDNVYKWYNDTLQLVGPRHRYAWPSKSSAADGPWIDLFSEMLRQLDTGIVRIGFEKIPAPDFLKLEQLKNDLLKLPEGETLTFGNGREVFIISLEGDETVVRKIVGIHKLQNGEEVSFDLKHESDGTRRLMDLIPAILSLCTPENGYVYFIDEIDRSLHSLLSKQLLELFLSSCSTETRSQLVFTTHDIYLMDQNLLRRDELWVTERDSYGCSNLFSFNKYKDLRYDHDLKNLYLKGKLGGIPHYLVNSNCLSICTKGED